MAAMVKSPSYIDLEMGLQSDTDSSRFNYRHSDGIKAQRHHIYSEFRDLPPLPLPTPSHTPKDNEYILLHNPSTELDKVVKYCGLKPGHWNKEYNKPEAQMLFWRLRAFNMIYIQQELIKIQQQIMDSNEISETERDRLHILLHEQVQANRDSEYLETRFQADDDYSVTELPKPWVVSEYWMTNFFSPFHHVKSKSSISSRLRAFLTSKLSNSVTWTYKERRERSYQYITGHRPLQPSLAVELIANSVIALSSATIIILPIIIMNFDPSRTKSLVTLSASVVLFGMLLTGIFRAKNTEVFAAVATYAAVLVVFVGTSGTASSG